MVSLITVLVTVLTLPCLVSSHATPCNVGNDTLCLEGVRDEFIRTDYWFGDGYAAYCPHGNDDHDFYCMNPDLQHKSIATRMMRDVAYDVMNIKQFLHIRWHTPPGHYVACGHPYDVDEFHMDIDLDNTHTIYYDAWIMGHQPRITFTPEDGVSYTMVAYDAGMLTLGGVWSNVVGGDLAFGTVVYPYMGPVGAMYEKRNPYVFALFAQRDIVNVEAVKASIVESIKNHSGIYHLDELIQMAGLEGPVGIGYVVIKSDVYGTQRYLDHGIINNCPQVLSWNEDLHKALEVMGYNLTDQNSYSSYRGTYLKGLELDLRLTYFSPEAEFDSCCEHVEKHFQVSLVDPLSDDAVGTFYTLMKPEILLTPIELGMPAPGTDHFYMLFMVDITDVDKNETSIMWQVANIQVNDPTSGDEVLPYHPPMNNETRTYVFLVISQPGRLQTESLWVYSSGDTCAVDDTLRCGFDFGGMVEGMHSKLVAISMLHSKMDNFARAVMYGDFKALTILGTLPQDYMPMNMTEVCHGVEGYADPCPHGPEDDHH